MTLGTPCPTCGNPIPPGSPGDACPRCLMAQGLASAGAEAVAPPSAEEMGRHFPSLEVLELLGQGGMGIVYKARQRHLERFVALKVLPPEVAREPGFAERFTREARTLARLQHPHIVGVHDFGESDGLFFLVMEFVDGPNLRQVIREGRLEARQALAIVPQVCDALQYAHDRGVVHRDVKPENILLDRDGKVKIADFGLAKLVQRAPVDVTLTRSGQVMGTLQYMAPEQYRAPDSVDHRADIYSLGVVFYEMLTGDLPVGSFPPPSSSAGVDVRLDAVVLRALERERDRRWQHASDVRTQVDSISASRAEKALGVDGAIPPVRPEPARSEPKPPLDRLAVAGALCIPAALVAGAIAGVITEDLTHLEEEDLLVPVVTLIVGGLVLLAGLAMSVAALVRMRREGGRLRGHRWAVLGAALPVPLFFAALGVHWLTSTDPSILRLANRAVREMATPDLGPNAHLRVVGGPTSLTDAQRAGVAAEIERVWATIRRAIAEPNPDVKASLLAPSERARLEAATREERLRLYAKDALGPVFVQPWDNPPELLRLVWVVLDADATRARVVRASEFDVVTYPVVREGRGWYPAIGVVELNMGALEDGKDGWTAPFVGSAGGPAAKVSGAAKPLDEADAYALLRDAWNGWRQQAPMWMGFVTDAERTGREPSDFLPYHVALDPDGRSGRLVLSDASSALALPIRRHGDDWRLVSEDVEWRVGAAGPEDRDGWLFR